MPSEFNARSTPVVLFAAIWFAILTALNLSSGGSLRGTGLYAVPMVLAAWCGVRLGFVFTAVGAKSAWAGGAIP